jgi:hypothetical protein
LWLVLQRHWRIGSLLFVAGVGWFFFVMLVLIPAASGAQDHVVSGFYDRYGDSFTAVVITMLTHPHRVLAHIAEPLNRSYLWILLLPFGLLPLLSPRYLVLATPALALNLLSSYEPQKTLLYQYSALPIAVAAVALLYSLLWLARSTHYRRALLAGCVALLLCCALSVQHSFMLRLREIERYRQFDTLHAGLVARMEQRNYILSFIPAGASVAVQTNLLPHIAHRETVFMFPNPFKEMLFYDGSGAPAGPVDYIVYDTTQPDAVYMPALEKIALLRELQGRGLYRQVLNAQGVLLLQRSFAALPEGCFGAAWDAPVCRGAYESGRKSSHPLSTYLVQHPPATPAPPVHHCTCGRSRLPGPFSTPALRQPACSAPSADDDASQRSLF